MARHAVKSYSYALRVNEVNAIYDHYARLGMSNRDIWRRYIHPRFGIAERTFYNYLKKDCLQGC